MCQCFSIYFLYYITQYYQIDICAKFNFFYENNEIILNKLKFFFHNIRCVSLTRVIKLRKKQKINKVQLNLN